MSHFIFKNFSKVNILSSQWLGEGSFQFFFLFLTNEIKLENENMYEQFHSPFNSREKNCSRTRETKVRAFRTFLHTQINFEKSFQTQFDPRVSSQKYGESFTTNNSRVVKSDHVTHPRKMYPVIKIGVVPEFIQEEPSKNEIVRTRDRSWKLSPAS